MYHPFTLTKRLNFQRFYLSVQNNPGAKFQVFNPYSLWKAAYTSVSFFFSIQVYNIPIHVLLHRPPIHKYISRVITRSRPQIHNDYKTVCTTSSRCIRPLASFTPRVRFIVFDYIIVSLFAITIKIYVFVCVNFSNIILLIDGWAVVCGGRGLNYVLQDLKCTWYLFCDILMITESASGFRISLICFLHIL